MNGLLDSLEALMLFFADVVVVFEVSAPKAYPRVPLASASTLSG